MSFFKLNNDKVAVITHERTYTYNEISRVEFKSTQKELVLILCENTIDILSTYVSAMNSQHAVMLLSADINRELLEDIIIRYEPKWIVGLESYDGYERSSEYLVRIENINMNIHPDLAILLSTSGTTGSQKFVRLSYENIRSNAESIILI